MLKINFEFFRKWHQIKGTKIINKNILQEMRARQEKKQLWKRA